MSQSALKSKKNKIQNRKLTAVDLLIMLGAALLIMTICSKASPIYPFNDWDDPNCFFTVGKAMANGQVLYRDIFEQKGPILYMLHIFTYYISPTTFFGVWLVEIGACFAFLVISFRIISLFCEGKIIFVVLPLGALTYTSLAFCCGDSAEELCLPLLAYSLYVTLSRVKTNTPVRAHQALVCGICAGIILWIKFTMLGFFVGFGAALVALYIRQKRFKRIFLCTGAVIAGLLIASIPVISYFAKYNAFDQLFEVYFYDNIFLYTTGEKSFFLLALLLNLLYGLFSFAVYNSFALILSVAGLIYLWKKQPRRLAFVYTVIFAATFLFSFMGGRAYAYYSLVMSVFSPVGISAIFILARKKLRAAGKPKLSRSAPVIVCILSLAVTCLLCRNTYLIFTPRDEMPQFRFSSRMSETKDPTMLNYGFLDGGFYTVSGIVPNCRFFCQLNVEYNEMYRVQDEYVENGWVDYVITKDKKPDFARYECIDECQFSYWTEKSTYYLYRLTEPKQN